MSSPLKQTLDIKYARPGKPTIGSQSARRKPKRVESELAPLHIVTEAEAKKVVQETELCSMCGTPYPYSKVRSPVEWCWLQRRRAGISQAEAAKYMNTRVELIGDMETGRLDSKPLVAFWMSELYYTNKGLLRELSRLQ